MGAHNLCEESKQTLGDVFPGVLNQVSIKGDVSHHWVLKVGKQGVLMMNELIRITFKHINIIRG